MGKRIMVVVPETSSAVQMTAEIHEALKKHGNLDITIEDDFLDQSRTDTKQDEDRADINDPPTEGGPVQT